VPRSVAAALAVASLAAVVIVGLVDPGERGHVFVGTPHHSLPGAYVAVPGPWHWRWVRVKNPPHGSPRYVHERYRTIRYTPAVP
jgi:hypothetical protein